MIFGLSLALGSALGTNLGFLFKHRGASSRHRSGCAIHCAAPLICFAHGGLRWGGSSRLWPGSCTWGRSRSPPCRACGRSWPGGSCSWRCSPNDSSGFASNDANGPAWRSPPRGWRSSG